MMVDDVFFGYALIFYGSSNLLIESIGCGFSSRTRPAPRGINAKTLGWKGASRVSNQIPILGTWTQCWALGLNVSSIFS